MTLRQLLRLGIGCSLFLALVAVVSAQGAETLLPASDSDSVFGLIFI
jgi:hypothetical protein